MTREEIYYDPIADRMLIYLGTNDDEVHMFDVQYDCPEKCTAMYGWPFPDEFIYIGEL